MAVVTAEQMIRDYFSVHNTHRIDDIMAYYTDDISFTCEAMHAVSHGKAEVKTMLRGMFAAFPDLIIEVKSAFASGNQAAYELVLSGTHKGDFPGLPATGKRFSVRGVTVAELQNGKLKTERLYWNLGAFLQQVGLMPGSPKQ